MPVQVAEGSGPSPHRPFRTAAPSGGYQQSGAVPAAPGATPSPGRRDALPRRPPGPARCGQAAGPATPPATPPRSRAGAPPAAAIFVDVSAHRDGRGRRDPPPPWGSCRLPCRPRSERVRGRTGGRARAWGLAAGALQPHRRCRDP